MSNYSTLKTESFLVFNFIRFKLYNSELEPTMNEEVVNKMLQSCFNYIMNCEASRKGEISYEVRTFSFINVKL